MYEYLFNYCQLEEKEVYYIQNYSHQQVQDIVSNPKISRFPVQYYQEELLHEGIILLVKDRCGSVIPYISPNVISIIGKKQLCRYLDKGIDLQHVLEHALLHSCDTATPVSYEPVISGYTSKKSYQKKIDYKRKRGIVYEEYQGK